MAINRLFESLLGTLCEIKSENNDTLAVVRAVSYESEGDVSRLKFEAANKSERLPLLTYESSVKVIAFAGNNNFVMLRGTVYISNDNNIVLFDVHAAQDYERRKFFRLNTNVKADVEIEVDDDDEELIPPFSATVLDVSLGGIRLGCTQALKDDTVLFVTFQLIDQKTEIFCRVCREIPCKENARGIRQYGCEFIDYTQRQIDLLCNDIFKLQRLEMQRRKKR